MNPVFQYSRIFLVGGPGGVGKTTLSAALAVALAEGGHPTLVLTVDPAKRLAQALGLKTIENSLTPVPLANGKLWASQLHTDRFLDELIHRIAKDPDQEQRIFSNPIYQTLSRELGGTQEYAAMERILEFVDQSQYTKIVVDTPPTQNALDLITAPRRMFDFMDTSVLNWFSGKTSFVAGLFGRSTHLALKALQRIFGSHFFDAFERFLKDIDGLQAGFQRRNFELMRLLRSDACAFLLTTIATEERVKECSLVQTALTDESIALRMILLNQFEPEPPSLTDEESRQWPRAAQWWAHLAELHASQARARDLLLKLKTPLVTLSRLDEPPSSLTDLSSLGAQLIE
ncbi:MAG: ArsA family ATPase [Deltaproteobacteria bacterium]|nr:ArsA family ATPase [Deltaproteobacteria bacterium]MBI3294391.1 ArsA family ATPase [Deltaproteobacteria bacterium]